MRFCLFLCMVMLATVPAGAIVGTVDDVPGASLLLPYFEVDLNDAAGVNTLLSVNNASATAVLAHVVIWSDLSVPVLDFNIYLTGYDVQTLNLRDLIEGGRLPRTASAGQDPGDTISPHGNLSQDINFASCTGQLPPPDLPANFIDHLKRSLTGRSSPILNGLCAGRSLGDNVARGYVTLDTVNNCTLRFPGDLGYFGPGGTGDATNQNVLWGDYFYVSAAGSYAQGETLVHIEASATDPETSEPGQYTFYGRYVDWTATDNREPLATLFAVRYLNGGAFGGGSDLLVWRDSKVNQGAFACGTLPSWYPLGQEEVVIFDEQENPDVPVTLPVSPQPPGQAFLPFPGESQLAEVGTDVLPTATLYGWLFLNLNTVVTPAGLVPPEDPVAAQAWVTVAMSSEPQTASRDESGKLIRNRGRFSVGFDAIRLDSATGASHTPIRE